MYDNGIPTNYYTVFLTKYKDELPYNVKVKPEVRTS